MKKWNQDFTNSINNAQTAFISDEDIIPIVYGTAMVIGKIIWVSKIDNQSYAAISICEGPIDSINYMIINGFQIPLWMLKALENDKQYEKNIGQNTKPSIIIQKITGTKECYKDLAYIVINTCSLAKLIKKDSNQLEAEEEDEVNPLEENLFSKPLSCWQFEFNVTRCLTSYKLQSNPVFTRTKDLISCISIIPGSGEFVYDTVEQKADSTALNVSEQQTETNCKLNLQYLKKDFQNLKWVSLIVSWYATSTNIENAEIKPMVESKKSGPNNWQVSDFIRYTATEISKDKQGDPRYGGTPDDSSVRRYIQELKKEGYKIMLYPFIQVDDEKKSWRGEITGKPEHVEQFFKNYNPFIHHYAKIAQEEQVDAFIIGSEMKELTRIYQAQGENRIYVAVNQFCKLAKEVKNNFSAKTQVSGKTIEVIYAADWDEYHNHEGWYNMDPLFMSIDAIGLDIYFPLTYTSKSLIKYNEIKKGITSGLDYDYYKDNRELKYCDKKYARKCIEEWWKEEHYNPNKKKSIWIPKAKKIWFTEFGFASMDKSTNEPNVFYTSESERSPYLSNVEVDSALQEQAIHAMLEEFQNAEFLYQDEGKKQMFLWCWDARYPFWPENKVYWNDTKDYIKGHWVCGKLNAQPIVDIIAHLCCQAGLDPTQILPPIDAKDLLQGIVINAHTSILDVMQLLQQLFCIDLYSEENYLISYRSENIEFYKEEQENIMHSRKEKSQKELKFSFDDIELQTTLISNYSVASYKAIETMMIYNIDENNYDVDVQEPYHTYEFSTAKALNMQKKVSINRGKFFVMPTSCAKDLADYLLFKKLQDNYVIVFCLPYSIDIFPSYLIKLYNKKISISIKVISVQVKNNLLTIKGLVRNYV